MKLIERSEYLNRLIDLRGTPDIKIITKNNKYYANVVVDAAGAYSDKIAEMVEPIDYYLTPRKGEYYVLQIRLNLL